jgi:phycoerythrin-associated linker protein
MALWIEAESIELGPKSSTAGDSHLQVVIRAVYRQVLGNAHVMDNQRLTHAESGLRNGDLSIREFVRTIAYSDLYRTRFFENSSPYRFIELNFKHFLGRAPQDQQEVSQHVQIYNGAGYTAEINSYLDSDEYFSNFGEHVVPSLRGTHTQVGIKNVGFNRTFALIRGFAASDVGKSAKLIRDLGGNLPTKIVAPARTSGAYSNTGKRFRVLVSKASFCPRMAEDATCFEVKYNQLSQKIQNIQNTGGKILSVMEIT